MPAEKDSVYKVTKRIAVIVLVGGILMGIIAAFIPGMPAGFPVMIPAMGLMIAAGLYRLTQEPRGSVTRRAVRNFNSAYRPLTPLEPKHWERHPSEGEDLSKIDPEKLRAEIEALKRRM